MMHEQTRITGLAEPTIKNLVKKMLASVRNISSLVDSVLLNHIFHELNKA